MTESQGSVLSRDHTRNKGGIRAGAPVLAGRHSCFGIWRMWSNLELSSTSFELGWARIPGGTCGAAAVGRDLISGLWEGIRTLDRQPNQLDPLIGQRGPVKIYKVLGRHPACLQDRDCPGQGSKVAINPSCTTVFPRDRLGGEA